MTDLNYGLFSRSELFDSIIKTTTYTNKKNERLNVEFGFNQMIELLIKNNNQDGAIYLIGNGGSAAVASHILTDFVNACRLRAFTLHDSPLITCMTNDFGYEESFKRIVQTVFKKNDILIAISSSGKSANICNAAKMASALEGTVITFSGFHEDNMLRKLGDLNFWLDSMDYGLVEIGHLFLLHNLADRIALEVKKENLNYLKKPA